ncbi:MAG: hypothetical protein LBP53_08485 [Candidatus Peribacteria bacterium]|nr:hypothetical protein [Candidatus Peribacteria bacterium]
MDKGLPVFSFPTLGPLNVMGVPIPPFRPINFQGAGGIFGGSSSQFRIYVAPTLTLQLGIAMCF